MTYSPTFDDLAGYVSYPECAARYSGQPFADPKIQVIQGAGSDADQHLVLARIRVRDLFVAQNFTTEFVDADGFHGSSEMKSKYHRRIKESHFGTAPVWSNQPLRFKSAALRGDHSNK